MSYSSVQCVYCEEIAKQTKEDNNMFNDTNYGENTKHNRRIFYRFTGTTNFYQENWYKYLSPLNCL